MTTDPVVHCFDAHRERDGDLRLRDDWIRDFGGERSDWDSVGGACPACGSEEGFRLANGADPRHANVREDLVCRHCGLSARIRAALWLLRRHRPLVSETRTYFTEQATPTFAWAQRHLPGEVVGSEFEPDAERRERLAAHLQSLGGHGEVCFGDISDLGYADASVDAIVSLDVLEHVPDYAQALREFRRVLRPGGVLVATFPFNDEPATRVRARLREGQVEHLCEPEFHGDPLGGGVLCWYHFGWDVLDAARAAGFASARMAMPCDPGHGLPYGLWTLLAFASEAGAGGSKR